MQTDIVVNKASRVEQILLTRPELAYSLIAARTHT